MSPEAKGSALLVLNAGSSSLKFAVFAVQDSGLTQRYDGQMEGIGAAPRFTLRDTTGAMLTDRRFAEAEAPKGHEGALGVILAALSPLLVGVIKCFMAFLILAGRNCVGVSLNVFSLQIGVV